MRSVRGCSRAGQGLLVGKEDVMLYEDVDVDRGEIVRIQ